MKEKKVMLLSTIVNFICACIKICAGIIGKSHSLISDGLQTLSDFVTDIVSIFGINIIKRRANKNYPYGFGNVEYLVNLFIGLVIFGLGIYILISSFYKDEMIPEFWTLLVLLFAILIKLISAFYLKYIGKKLNSGILINSSKESFLDIYASLLVMIVIILSQFHSEFHFLIYSDFVGSLIIGIIVLVSSVNILKESILNIVGKIELNSELEEKVLNILECFKHIVIEKITFFKYGSYYRLDLKLSIDPKIKVLRLVRLEEKITKSIKKSRLGIKYITIEIVERKNKKAIS